MSEDARPITPSGRAPERTSLMPVVAATSCDAVPAGVGSVVFGVDAAATRRHLGPVSWCVLEIVVAASDQGGLAAVSIRSIAVELGLSKNTVQRAVATMRAAGLIEPIGQRRDHGRFGDGGYRIDVARSVLAPVGPAATPVREDRRSSRRSRRVVRPVVFEQLSLLPEV